ncbi:bifunctional 4-hydroxy-2-oxoglutarate aldolase/2-dehydro-3-deoxy-phosphogluconate aldolase [Sphingomonas sp.]|uniref:bifunctional 4-hydroxy-2-oxoglutarate aldolase/2-dehydro-3-deoxy-phosphogluconate aldolase n=1 Tax=Sphingomonas sp. TaxID=28214 RepID=UPI0025D90C10|nr:bifunctional 4-hydroxy-2-oxoglutarate aldolase/2-dehydro-3-deoxy-phosphogluconate aldolase [Sphingomonas sp.]MBV9526759.1 bifunctional 4-hydroxy-2-oxoglutarate aldolase/2-dehydro-3-deoxy-phosphogluconate aldolase [Sphingomonas sp.]
MKTVDEVMALAPVIPVLVVDEVAHARPIAEALVAGGIRALEVTLRTPAALDVIAAMAEVEGALVGAGTVLNGAQLDQSIAAGARFIVSPGLTEGLGRAAIARGIPFLPGVSDAADIMRGLDLGLTRFKFFPAEASGGIAALKALAAPFHQCRFCPTGGITQSSAPDWLAVRAVACVGGSWLVSPGDPDIPSITASAHAAAALWHS